MDPGTVIDKIEGIETIEPVFGLSAVWINEEQREDAQYNGYTVVDTSTIIATHLTEILKVNLYELFGRQELNSIVDNFKETNPKIVNDLIPEILPFGVVLKVVQNLLREGIPVRDMRTILETLAEYGLKVKDAQKLTEFVRVGLHRTITESVRSKEGDVPVFNIDKDIQEKLISGIIKSETGEEYLSLEPSVSQGIFSSLNEKIEEATEAGEDMVVLCPSVIRGHFKQLTEKIFPTLVVVSYDELSSETSVRSLGTVRL